MGKKVVKDINESTGKLPPSSKEIEDSLLGLLLLYRAPKILSLLRASYFFYESNRIVFEAILSLNTQNKPIDLLTVLQELHNVGKDDLIGGASYLTELTSNLVSAADPEYHARIIIELYIKREVIRISSGLTHEAYDGVDALELLDQAKEQIRQLHESTIVTPTADKIKIIWGDILVDKEPEPEVPLILIGDAPVCTAAEYSLIVGKKKSRKSLFIAWVISEYLKTGDDAAIFDTEQGRRHVWRYQDRIFRLSGKKVPIFSLRGRSCVERRQIIEDTLDHWPKKFKIIVIDGIRDLIKDINNSEESNDLIAWIERLILKHRVHVMNVLHANKGDNNPRGHLGTELVNKVQTTIELVNDEKTNVTTVSCESSRDKPFDAFAITHDANDLPMVVDVPINGQSLSEDDRRNRLHIVFEDGPIKYKELQERIMAQFSCGATASVRVIAELRRMGMIMKTGRDKDPTTLYQLGINANNTGQSMESIVIPDNEALPF